jgi:hypothetical protein
MFSWPHFLQGIGMTLGMGSPSNVDSGLTTSRTATVLLNDWKKVGLQFQSVMNEKYHDRRKQYQKSSDNAGGDSSAIQPESPQKAS